MSRFTIAAILAATTASAAVADMPSAPNFLDLRQTAVAFGDMPAAPAMEGFAGVRTTVYADLPAAPRLPRRVAFGDMPAAPAFEVDTAAIDTPEKIELASN